MDVKIVFGKQLLLPYCYQMYKKRTRKKLLLLNETVFVILIKKMLDFNKAASSVVLVFLECGVRVLCLSAVGADMTSSCSLELEHRL